MCTTHRLDVSMIWQPQGRRTSPKAHLPAWHIHVHMALLSLSRNDINRRGEEPPRIAHRSCVRLLTEQLSSLLCLLVRHAAPEATSPRRRIDRAQRASHVHVASVYCFAALRVECSRSGSPVGMLADSHMVQQVRTVSTAVSVPSTQP